MKKRTIREAAIEALTRCGKPLYAKDVYNFIIEHDLYRFNAENPEGIVKVEIRRHCEGVEFPTAKPNKYFKILLDGTYWLKDIPIPGQKANSQKSEIIVKKDTENIKSVVAELKAIHSKHADTFNEYSGLYCTIQSGVKCTIDSGVKCTLFRCCFLPILSFSSRGFRYETAAIPA